jgi:hypothetical protein
VAPFDEKMCIKSWVDWTYFKVRLKFINNKPKSQQCTKDLPKPIPRSVFKAYIGDYLYGW